MTQLETKIREIEELGDRTFRRLEFDLVSHYRRHAEDQQVAVVEGPREALGVDVRGVGIALDGQGNAEVIHGNYDTYEMMRAQKEAARDEKPKKESAAPRRAGTWPTMGRCGRA